MKTVFLAVTLSILVSSSAFVRAQEKVKSEETDKATANRREMTPLRIQVVFTESEGERKISNLPYTLLVNAQSPDQKLQKAAIRMGLRVPVPTSSTQFQYIEVGTNMDGWAYKLEDGRFALHLNLERSSSYSSTSAGQKTAPGGQNEPLSVQPTIQQFKTEVDLLMRDGQTTQSTLATDPVSGRVLRVDVTLNVMK